MKAIMIEASHSTPAINFCEDGRLLIEGRSLPEDVNKFYKPLIEWIINLNTESVRLDFNLEYFKSSLHVRLLSGRCPAFKTISKMGRPASC